MSLYYHNEHCKIAAYMLNTEPSLLDYHLVEYLNSVAEFVEKAGGKLRSRQIIALAIASWQRREISSQ